MPRTTGFDAARCLIELSCMKKAFIFSFIALITGFGSVSVFAQSQPAGTSEITREEAITRLSQLVDFYDINLSGADEELSLIHI